MRHDAGDEPKQSLGAVLLPFPPPGNLCIAAIGDSDPDRGDEGRDRDAGKRDGANACQPVGSGWCASRCR